MSNITIEALRVFSSDGDQEAKRILDMVEQYSAKKEQQLNQEIRVSVRGITEILSKPETITGRDSDVWLEVAEIATSVASLISPVCDDTEFIG